MKGNKLTLVTFLVGLLMGLTPFAASAAPTPSPVCQDECTHPMALMLSEWMDVDCQALMAYHADGVGFGVIMKAYVLSEAFDPGNWEGLLTLHQEDVGWGQIVKAYALAGPLERSPVDLLADAQARGWGEIVRDYREKAGPGKPPWAAKGKPPWAEARGKPEWAGPHESED
jgi:hypothetical protein